MEILKIKSLTKSFNPKEGYVINDINLIINKGTVTSLLGESGSGKTTLARLVAGLETPDSGSISLADVVIASESKYVQPQDRGVGMVFQDYALFPHMTVSDNVGYGLKNKDKENRILEVLRLVGLEDLKDRFPHQLSGGQQQRIALARALAPNPKLLLLDEPFSNLDASLKRNLRSELFQIIRESKVTAIFLTHDIQDAMAVSDNIVVLKNGVVIQEGTPKSLYKTPKTIYIAALFSAVLELSNDDITFFNYPVQSNKKYAIRQDAFLINDNSSAYAAEVKIVSNIFLGNHYSNKGILPNNNVVLFNSNEELNGTIQLGFNEGAILVFDN